MSISKNMKIFIILSLALLIFTIWFSDGYMQRVNSDTAGEASGASQNVAFPQGLLLNHHPYHSRITGASLSYIPFHTVGYIYRELTGDPVNALYVSQGVMTGAIFVFFVFVSSSFISVCAPILSIRYLFSALFLLLLTMSMPPILSFNAPVSLVLRFGHQAVMTNYVGTMTIALFAVFPYWRYLLTGNWDDWYIDMKYRSIYYIIILSAVFSSTATMLWIGTFAVVTFLSFIYFALSEQKTQKNILTVLRDLANKSTMHPLIIVMFLCIIGVIAESVTERGSSTLSQVDLINYFYNYMLFIINSKTTWCFITISLILIFIITIRNKKGTISPQLIILAKLFPWLLAGNLIYLLIVGFPRIEFRFNGYNLSSDIALPVTWSMALWLITILMYFWRERSLTWLIPLLLFSLSTNSLYFFRYDQIEKKIQQKQMLKRLYIEDTKLQMDIALPIVVGTVAFSPEDLTENTIPMLRSMGIISESRAIRAVSIEDYNAWHEDLTNKIPSFFEHNL